MSRIQWEGAWRHRIRSALCLAGIGTAVTLRHALGRRLDPRWSRDQEIGNRFWRGQFNHALALPDIGEGRAYFDSLQTHTDEVFDVSVRPTAPSEPKGEWLRPETRKTEATMLYLHGGGYSFYAAISRRFHELLSHTLGIDIFAPDYRLTPEHPHPAQIEDALAAYRYLLASGVNPKRLVIAGDSAGGHLTLMTLVALRATGLPQPALAIGLCPWTDIGRRGASQFGNDRYDLVQGYMTLKFGEWLKGDRGFSDAELSPMQQDYRGLAPIYLQGGGREILIDMIRDFARKLRDQDVWTRLDVFDAMTHDFQHNGMTQPESREALERIAAAIEYWTGSGAEFAATARTEVVGGGG